MRPVLFAVLISLTPAAALPVQADDMPARRITVTGAATVTSAPDLATISGGVETQGKTAAEALAENARAMTQVLDGLAKLGIAKADIQTTRLSLNPVFEQSEDGRRTPQVIGYEAGNMVSVAVRATDQLGAVIDAMGSGGANRIDGIGFDIADPRALLETARENAVADARAKAETLSRSAGVELGEVLRIDESVPSGGPGPMRARMDMAAPIAPGSVEVGTEVTITYALR